LNETAAELARELVDLKVDVIVTSGLAFMPRTRSPICEWR
jgi:hypothetical protein